MTIGISLSKKVNYPELGGVMTKKEFIERARAAQWTTQAKELNGYQNGEFNRRHFNRLTGDTQREYEKKLEKVKTVYSIHPPGQSSFYDITVSEYQYFQSLEGPELLDIDGTVRNINGYPTGKIITRAIDQ